MTGLCAYCRQRPAVNRDHVVPRAMQKKYLEAKGYPLPEHLTKTVKACFECNMRKGTRKLVPQSWRERIADLKDLIPGEWRIWTGGVREPAFAEVHR